MVRQESTLYFFKYCLSFLPLIIKIGFFQFIFDITFNWVISCQYIKIYYKILEYALIRYRLCTSKLVLNVDECRLLLLQEPLVLYPARSVDFLYFANRPYD